MKIRTPKGRRISARQYLARVERLVDPYSCKYGHHGDAAWEGGPCANEVVANLDAQESELARLFNDAFGR